MPVSADTFGSLGGAVDSLFGAAGQFQAASGFKKAAGYSKLQGQIAQQATRIQQLQAQREIYRTIGGQRADFGGAGLTLSGGALDVMRDSASQGALTRQLIAAQGAIEALGYEAETEAYLSQAAAAKTAGKGGILGGVLKLAATAFTLSDDSMKEDITLVERRRDGLGLWEFRYRGQPTRFRGVLASEVERLYPTAVKWIDGLRHVNYDLIGVTPEVALA